MEDMNIYVPKTQYVGYYESIRIRELIKTMRLSLFLEWSPGEIHRSLGLFFSYIQYLHQNLDKLELRKNISEADKNNFRQKITEAYELLLPFAISKDSGIFLKRECQNTAISLCTELLERAIDKAF